MEGLVSVIEFLDENMIVAVTLEVVSFLLLWALFVLIWMVHKSAKEGRAALHSRLDEGLKEYNQHEITCAERWGTVSKHMEIVEKKLDKL